MSTVASKKNSFAMWITGLPASGKSVISAAVAQKLKVRGIDVTVLESDVLRKQFSSTSAYEAQDRDYFYASVAFIGQVLTEHGIPVIFDATANRRAYRDRARGRIPRFLEIHVDTPLEVCMDRDPKGIYQKAVSGESRNVPGIQAEYEAPQNPDLVIHGHREAPEEAAARIIDMLAAKGWI
jgi:adenylylsulfate kinase